MTSFNKQLHEYKGVGGWLLLLCFSLIVISPLFNIYLIQVQYENICYLFNDYPGLRIVFYIDLVLSTIIVILGIRAGVCLFKIKPQALKIAKTYLLLHLGTSLITKCLPFIAGLPHETNMALIPEVVTESWRSIVFFGVWYPYLIYSKRVKVTYSLSNHADKQNNSSKESKTLAAEVPEFAKKENNATSYGRNPDLTINSKRKKMGSFNSHVLILIGVVFTIILTIIIGNYQARNSLNGQLELYFLVFDFTVSISQAYVLYFILISVAISLFMAFFYYALKAMGQRITPHNNKLFPFQFISKGYYRLFLVISATIIIVAYFFSFNKIMQASNGEETDILYLFGLTDHLFKGYANGFFLDYVTTVALTIFTIPIIYYILASFVISVFKWVYDGFMDNKAVRNS